MLSKDTKQIRQAVAIARQHHWGFRAGTQAGILLAPVYHDGWVIEPVLKTHPDLPKQALRRVSTLERSGLSVVQLLLAHEAPRLLSAPYAPPPNRGEQFRRFCSTLIRDIPWKDIAHGAGTLIEVSITAAGMVLSIGFQLLSLLVLVDPALICVLEDAESPTGYSFVEVMRWVS